MYVLSLADGPIKRLKAKLYALEEGREKMYILKGQVHIVGSSLQALKDLLVGKKDPFLAQGLSRPWTPPTC